MPTPITGTLLAEVGIYPWPGLSPAYVSTVRGLFFHGGHLYVLATINNGGGLRLGRYNIASPGFTEVAVLAETQDYSVLCARRAAAGKVLVFRTTVQYVAADILELDLPTGATTSLGEVTGFSSNASSLVSMIDGGDDRFFFTGLLNNLPELLLDGPPEVGPSPVKAAGVNPLTCAFDAQYAYISSLASLSFGSETMIVRCRRDAGYFSEALAGTYDAAAPSPSDVAKNLYYSGHKYNIRHMVLYGDYLYMAGSSALWMMSPDMSVDRVTGVTLDTGNNSSQIDVDASAGRLAGVYGRGFRIYT